MTRIWIVIAAAVALVLAACSSSSDDAQPAQQPLPQAQQQAQTQEQSSDTETTAASSEASSQPQQQEEVEEAPAEDESEQAQATTDSQAGGDQSDDSAGDAEQSAAVAIIEPANYDDLSPRLQLLRDSGYPVYVSDAGYTIALGTPDVSTGQHRISVVIESPVGLVEFPAIAATAVREDAPGEEQDVIARYARFPDGIRGFHVTTVDFTQAGRWHIILHVPAEDGFTDLGLALDIAEDTSAPSVGDAAPASDSRTLTDVANIADLSTGETPDPGLYLISLADAVAADKPFVVVFASPGFCTNAFCGPQAEVLSEVREVYGDAANYVHVDLYENPEQVRYGEEPIETPILEEWGLHTDEWTFVVNADGVVTHRFEAFAPFAEVEAALGELLDG